MAEQDLDQVIESLKRLGSVSKAVSANSRYTPPAGGRAAITLNDARLNALRQAPQLADQINSLAKGETPSSGALGTIGKVLIDNPISKTVLGGLTIVDTPRRAVISGVRELVDLVDEDKKTKFSFNDFFSQTKNTSYGFGTAFPMEGWAGRLVGFVGDIALDPLTYASLGASVPGKAIMEGTEVSLRTALGAKTVAGAEGRFALARLAREMGAADEVVKNIAAKGRIAVPKELAENMGLRRSGIYFFGGKVRAPLSGPIADAIQQGLVKTRLGFFSTSTGEKLGQKFALRGTRQQADTALQRFNLATGRLSGKEAAGAIATLGAEDTARAYERIAMDTAVKYVSPLLKDADVNGVRGSVYRLLDTEPAKWAEKGIVPTANELKAYDKLKGAFAQMHADVESAFKAIDPNFTLGKIEDYLPHIATDDALKLMDDLSSPYAKKIREYLTVNMTDAVGSFRSRHIREGAEFFGKKLTKEDVAGGVARLNEIARSPEFGKLPFDFFETDMEKIMTKYVGYYSRQMGTAKYMQDLMKSGALSAGKTTWEFNDQMVKMATQQVKEATSRYSNVLKETYEKGKTMATTLSEVFSDLSRGKATKVRKVGLLQSAVEDAKTALSNIDPIEVATERLNKAQSILTDRMNTLSEEMQRLLGNFESESEVLSMLRASNDQLIDEHQKVLDSIQNLVKFYKEDYSFTGLANLGEDITKAVDAEGYVAPQIFDRKGRQLNVGEVYKKLKDDVASLDQEILDHGKRWEAILEAQDKVNDWFTDPFRLPWDQPSKEFDNVLNLFRDFAAGGRYSGITSERSLQKAWNTGFTDAATNAIRERIDPAGKLSRGIFTKMDIVEVRDIISRGYTSAANIRDLRKAGVWLVARDAILNGGLPTDAMYVQRAENLAKHLEVAYKVEELLGSKVASAEDIARGALPDTEQYVKAVSVFDDLQSKNDGLVLELDDLDLQLEAVIDNDAEAASIRKEIDSKVKEWEQNRKQLESAKKRVDDISKRSMDNSETGKEARELVARGDFRRLAEDLTDALSLYYVNSQTQIQFSRLTEAAALVGMVPDEKMYNNLLASIAHHDIEAAHGVLNDAKILMYGDGMPVIENGVERVPDGLFKEIQKKVNSYQGLDKSAFLLNEFLDIFRNPARAEDAERIRRVFPEFEAVVAKRIGRARTERVMFNDPEVTRVGGIADTAIRLLKEAGLESFAGEQTGRRASAGARRISGTGRETLAGIAETGMRQIGSAESQAAEWDRLYPMLKRNIKKLRTYAERPTTAEDTRTAINSLIDRYVAAEARARQQIAYSKNVLDRMTGSKSIRVGEAYLNNAIAFGRAHGMSESLDRALRGKGQYSIDSFFAELIGGTKLDVRQGYTTRKLAKGKLVSRANKGDFFVNIFQNDAGQYVDGAGRLVNGAGELVAEDGTVLMERVVIDGEQVDRPILGKKSSRPTILIRDSESYMANIAKSAEKRLKALRVLSDDAEFAPLELLKSGSFTADSPGGFGFENLGGPRGYANQLDIQAQILDEKIQRASKLEKEIAAEQRRLDKSGKPQLTPAQTKRIEAERRAAANAARRKNALEQKAIHTRALERRDFNNFLNELSSLSEEAALKMDWGISTVGPISGKEAQSVYSIQYDLAKKQLDVVSGEIKTLKDDLFRVMRNEPSTSPRAFKLRKKIQDLELRGAEIMSEMETSRTIAEQVRNITDPAKVEAVLRRQPSMRFGFNADEWRSLWTAPKTKAEIASAKNRISELKAQLTALYRQEEVALRSEFPYNFPPERRLEIRVKIKEVADEIDSLSNDVNMEFVRDNALKKAKLLHERFSDAQYQGMLNVADRETLSRSRVDTGIKLGNRRSTAQLEAARARGEITEAQFRDAVGFPGKYSETESQFVAVSPDKALRRYTKGAPKDAPTRIRDRRSMLRELFVNSEEGKHLAEVQKASDEIKTVYRNQYSDKVNNWRISRDSMRKTIADKREQIRELNIAAGVKEMQDVVDKASGVVGKLPKIEKGQPAKSAKGVIKAIDKGVEARRAETPFLRRSEELFGSLEKAQTGQLNEMQLRRRNLIDQIANMDYAMMAEAATQKEAIDALKELVTLSDRQAAVLGLPSKSQLKEQFTLAKRLEVQMRKVDSISGAISKNLNQQGNEYVRLSNAVNDARMRFNSSQMFRASAEENVAEAKRAVESVRELAAKSRNVRGTMRQKNADWISGVDDFLGEVNGIMPLLDDTGVDKQVKKVVAAYLQSKSKLVQAELSVDLAKREEALYKGFKGLTAKELGSLDLPPGAVNIKTQFDEGFIQLSRYFPNIGVRKELAEIVQNVHRLQDPAIVKELSKALGAYTKFFKSYATLSPGFHVRNAMSNFFMLFAAGGRIDYLAEGTKWSQLWSKMSSEGKNFDQFLAVIPEANKATVRDAFLAAAASGGGMTEDALSDGALWGTKTSRKVGNWIEMHSRFMLAYDGIRQGMDFNTAAARVRRFLIDYQNVSSGDQFMRQIVPFWMWTSRNLPMQVQNIWLNPKPYQIYGAIKRNFTDRTQEEPVPEWMQEIGSFKLPFGKSLYAVPDFGFNRINQQVQELRDPQRLLSNLNPALRLPIELAGGRQFYSNRQFSKTPIEVEGGLSTVLQPLLEALGYGETGPDGTKYVNDKAYYLARNVAPFLGTAERLVPSIPTYQQRGTTNQWLGFVGAPVRQNTAAMQEGELKRSKQLLQEWLSKQKAIGVIPTEGE